MTTHHDASTLRLSLAFAVLASAPVAAQPTHTRTGHGDLAPTAELYVSVIFM